MQRESSHTNCRCDSIFNQDAKHPSYGTRNLTLPFQHPSTETKYSQGPMCKYTKYTKCTDHYERSALLVLGSVDVHDDDAKGSFAQHRECWIVSIPNRTRTGWTSLNCGWYSYTTPLHSICRYSMRVFDIFLDTRKVRAAYICRYLPRARACSPSFLTAPRFKLTYLSTYSTGGLPV